MQLSHTPGRASASLDEPNLVGSAGLVPALAGRVGLVELADAAVLGGMLAGADSIDDLDLLRHGAMGKQFSGCGRRPRWVARRR